MAKKPKSEEADQVRVNEAKWSKPLIDAGYTVIPNVLIEKQAALGLDALDMNIILHLSSYWWRADNLPHPSVQTIADAIGCKKRTVQKRIAALHSLGLMEREERRQTRFGSATNLYSFKGLIRTATPFAEEKLAEKQAHKEETEKRINRKKPKLVVDNDGSQ